VLAKPNCSSASVYDVKRAAQKIPSLARKIFLLHRNQIVYLCLLNRARGLGSSRTHPTNLISQAKRRAKAGKVHKRQIRSARATLM
jgi:hypothetical protein